MLHLDIIRNRMKHIKQKQKLMSKPGHSVPKNLSKPILSLAEARDHLRIYDNALMDDGWIDHAAIAQQAVANVIV